MANLLGDLWVDGQAPNWPRALARAGVKLHLYGKTDPRSGRKMGHLTFLADDAQSARAGALAAREELLLA
jgi:5-(carboxyamino)imidazole ribonucleotide synthase